MDNEPTPQGQPITPELANQQPEAYKDLLIEKLGSHAPLAALILHKLVESGLVPSNQPQQTDKLEVPSGLRLDTTTWVSNSRVGEHMTIGTQPIPPTLKHELQFEDGNFDYERELAYKVSHEIAHLFASYVIDRNRGKYPEFEELHDLVKHIRNDSPKSGLSTLGNLEFYKAMGTDIQANEDFTELVAKYLYSPDYLKRYLAFLSSQDNANLRQDLRIEDLAPDSSQEIYNTIKSTVDSEI